MDKEDTQLSAIVNHYKCIINKIEMNHISEDYYTKATNETRAFFFFFF